MFKQRLIGAAAVALMCMWAQHSIGNEDSSANWKGFAALGTGIMPEYDGAEDNRALPFVFSRLSNGPYWVQIQGQEFSANLVDDKRWRAGPVVQLRFGRDQDAENDVVATLTEIDDSFEVGLFASYVIPGLASQWDALVLRGEAVQDVTGGHNGALAELSAAYISPLSRSFRLTTAFAVSYANDDYFDAYFSVNDEDSTRSGLSEFKAEAGLRDVRLSVTANYAINDRWGLVSVLGVSRYLSDAVDSPIVTEQGLNQPGFAAFAVSYKL